MDLSSLNKAGKASEFLPMKKLSTLTVMKDHHITDLRFVTTQFGKSIAAGIEAEYTVFLPKRIVTALKGDKDQFAKMVVAARENKLRMEYQGGKYKSHIQFK